MPFQDGGDQCRHKHPGLHELLAVADGLLTVVHLGGRALNVRVVVLLVNPVRDMSSQRDLKNNSHRILHNVIVVP